MVKVGAKEIAVQLRKEGHSYSHILKHLHVSKSTLTVWLAKVPFVPNKETIDRIGNAQAAAARAKNALRTDSIESAVVIARKDVENLSDRDIFMLGLGLYIGEGSKSLQETRFVNADSYVMSFIVQWFIVGLKVPRENFSVRIHMYPDSDEEQCLAFWSEKLNIPRQQFMSSYVDRRVDKKAKKAGKLPFGTAHLKVKSLGKKEFGVFLARRIMACMDMVLEKKRG